MVINIMMAIIISLVLSAHLYFVLIKMILSTKITCFYLNDIKTKFDGNGTHKVSWNTKVIRD